MNATPLTYFKKKDGSPNAIYDLLNRMVVSFPEVAHPSDPAADRRIGSPRTPEAMEEYAKLFCAAPDLLTALERLTAAMDDYDGNVPADLESPYTQALAAIAKAKGE